jgi:malate dehydrogenase (oxaloacetate-decarboxylating)
LSIPVLHDDQHGTAVVALAALLNGARRVGRPLGQSVVGQVGLGAAGLGIARLLTAYGVKRLLGSDLREDAKVRLEAMGGERADLQQLMVQSDVVIATTGVRGLIKPEWVRSGQVILALSNPTPKSSQSLRSSAALRSRRTARASTTFRVFRGCSRVRWKRALGGSPTAC